MCVQREPTGCSMHPTTSCTGLRPFCTYRSGCKSGRTPRCTATNRLRLQAAQHLSGQMQHMCQRAACSWTATLQSRLLQGALPACLALLVVTSPWLGRAEPAAAVTTEQLIFLEAWRAVDRAYVDKSFNGQSWFRLREQFLKNEPLKTRQETYAAIEKALALLDDPFTRFLEPARYQAIKRGTSGSVTGVGLEVGFKQEAGRASELVVVTPAPGGPAERAGVRPRDVLLAIGGRSTRGMSLFEAGDLLQGADGSQVELQVARNGGGDPVSLALRRERISTLSVTSQLCSSTSPRVGPGGTAGKLGYIRIATFNKQTADTFRQALDRLRDQGAERYLVDLRNNGGGSFPAGVEVARMLINSGDVVLIADSQGVRDVYDANNTALEAGAPVSVLVNRGTASASEVLAGALQDNKRGTIVGEQTYGKGLIQTIVGLSDGSGLAITVAKYQTPLGTDINRRGIAPDLKLGDADLPAADPGAMCSALKAQSAPRLF